VAEYQNAVLIMLVGHMMKFWYSPG